MASTSDSHLSRTFNVSTELPQTMLRSKVGLARERSERVSRPILEALAASVRKR
jgi:hypothetical protein